MKIHKYIVLLRWSDKEIFMVKNVSTWERVYKYGRDFPLRDIVDNSSVSLSLILSRN